MALLSRDDFTRLNIRDYVGWLLYDVANTFYSSGILTLMALTWILVKGQQFGLNYAESQTLFNLTLSLASIFMAFMLPVLGSVSDVLNERKRFVLIFSAIAILGTAVFSLTDNIYLILVLFAISMIAYQWAQVFYDAMLPGVVPPGSEAKLSSLAIAIGYIGGAFVVLYATFISGNEPNANPNKGAITLGYFPQLIAIILVGFFLFALPLVFVKETDWHELSRIQEGDQIDLEEDHSIWDVVRSSFIELKETFVHIKDNNIGMFYYIISYFIIADFANLLVLINATYLRDGLNLPENMVLNVTIVTGISIMLFSYFIGQIADRWGAKRSFQVIGVLWLLAIMTMILVKLILPIEAVFVAAILVAPAFSGVWISQRQMVLELVPTEQEVGRYFGLTKFSGKISSSIGPPLWSLFFVIGSVYLEYQIVNAYRFALIGMTIILIGGFLILHFKVPNNHKQFKERKRNLLNAINRKAIVE